MDRLTSTEIIAGHYHNIPTVLDMQQVVDRLAEYEDTGLTPEEITVKQYGCIFYCNRRCNLTGDWCAEGPGCQSEMTVVQYDRLCELAAADHDGRVVVLPCKAGDLLSKLEKLQNSAAEDVETYTTGYRNGHRNGQAELIRYIFGIGDGSALEAEAALKEQEEQK